MCLVHVKCRLSAVNFVECVVWWPDVGCISCVCRWQCGAVRNCSAWLVLVNGVNGGAKCILMRVVFL